MGMSARILPSMPASCQAICAPQSAVHAHDGYAVGVDIFEFGEGGHRSPCHFHPLEPRRLAGGRADGEQIAETGGRLRVGVAVGIRGSFVAVAAVEVARVVAKADHISLRHQRAGDIVESPRRVAGGEQEYGGTRVAPAVVKGHAREHAHPAALRLFGSEEDVRSGEITLFGSGNYGSLRPVLDGIETFPYFRRRHEPCFHSRNYSPK